MRAVGGEPKETEYPALGSDERAVVKAWEAELVDLTPEDSAHRSDLPCIGLRNDDQLVRALDTNFR